MHWKEYRLHDRPLPFRCCSATVRQAIDRIVAAVVGFLRVALSNESRYREC
jgi:hypothetical protein